MSGSLDIMLCVLYTLGMTRFNRDMPLLGKIALLVGLSGFIAFVAVNWPGPPGPVFGALRTASLVALLVGVYLVFRRDEFFARMHLYASAICVALSLVIIYGSYQLGLDLGRQAFSVICMTYSLSYLGVFVYQRRA